MTFFSVEKNAGLSERTKEKKKKYSSINKNSVGKKASEEPKTERKKIMGMYVYLKVPPIIAGSRGGSFVASKVDLILSAVMLISHFLNPGMGVWAGVSLVFNVSHLATWAFAATASANMTSIPFLKSAWIAYFFAFIFDWISLAIRIWRATVVGGLFWWFTFGVSIAFLVLDFVELLITAGLTRLTKKLRIRIERFIKGFAGSNYIYQSLNTVQRWTYKWRRRLMTAKSVHLGLILVLGFFVHPALSLSTFYSTLYLFDIPQTFLWVFARALAGTSQTSKKSTEAPGPSVTDALVDRTEMWPMFVALVGGATLSGAAFVIRLICLISESFFPTIVPPSMAKLRLILGWFAFVLSTALFAVSVYESWLAYKLIGKSLKREKDFNISKWGEALAVAWEKEGLHKMTAELLELEMDDPREEEEDEEEEEEEEEEEAEEKEEGKRAIKKSLETKLEKRKKALKQPGRKKKKKQRVKAVTRTTEEEGEESYDVGEEGEAVELETLHPSEGEESQGEKEVDLFHE